MALRSRNRQGTYSSDSDSEGVIYQSVSFLALFNIVFVEILVLVNINELIEFQNLSFSDSNL